MQNRIIEVDDFIAELWKVHLKVKDEGYVQVCLLATKITTKLLILCSLYPWACSDQIT